MDYALNPRASHQALHLGALRAGLRRHGITHAAGVVACWGWRQGAPHRRAGKQVLVLERGYLADRFSYTSIAWNGLNGRGEFPEWPEDGGDRLRGMGVQLQPVRAGGEYVLIAGQVPGDAALAGRNLAPWYEEQAKAAAEKWGMPVLFRPHPLAKKRAPVRPVPGTRMHVGPLDQALAGAAVVITYNSNTGVDALVAGRRATCADAGSMIWGVAMECRQRWAERLAWRQWSIDEIRSGFALERVVERIRG